MIHRLWTIKCDSEKNGNICKWRNGYYTDIVKLCQWFVLMLKVVFTHYKEVDFHQSMFSFIYYYFQSHFDHISHPRCLSNTDSKHFSQFPDYSDSRSPGYDQKSAVLINTPSAHVIRQIGKCWWSPSKAFFPLLAGSRNWLMLLYHENNNKNDTYHLGMLIM